MLVQETGNNLRLELDRRETQLLRWALERASFIDTPVSEQPAIQTFCRQLLEALAPRATS
jgi:hypothetical protein